MDRILTQTEADALMAVEKRCALTESLAFPGPGVKVLVPVESLDGREKFILDINRASIKLTQCTYQERVRVAIILARVDIDGPTHTNPDGVEVPCPHIHLYREGYGVTWAMPLPAAFTSPGDLLRTLTEFCSYCHVTQLPLIQGTLV